ncbi:MAG: hypothetical protein JO128_22570 [Alphaproteobacteria bacterium]|nr:hypothetical protein [Alphaproteobacteria bacterium]
MRRVLRIAGLALLLSPGWAAAQTVAVTDADCAKIVNYTTLPGVEYQPGVDVYGRKVAPADLPSSQPQIGAGPITIDITADLHKYGVPASSPLLLPGAHLGQLTVDDLGRKVYFNGQPLGDSEEKAIADACRQRQNQHR